MIVSFNVDLHTGIIMPLNFTILYGSYLSTRTGIRIVKYIESTLDKQGHHVNVIDAMTMKIPLIEKRYCDYEPQQAPPMLTNLKNIYENKTDAFIIVAGEYNGTLQPGLKNLLDYFYKEYFHRPSGIITYSVGKLGGVRASADLRTLTGIFGMPAIPTILSFPEITQVLDESGQLINQDYQKPIKSFIDELSWYGKALLDAKAYFINS